MTMLLTPGEAHQARCGAAQRECLTRIAKAMEDYRGLVYASHELFLQETKDVEDAERVKSP